MHPIIPLHTWCKLQGMKNRDGDISKKNLNFHWIESYCIVNYDIKNTYLH